MKIAIIAALLLMPVTAFAEITGKPRIIDGDTIEISDQRIRLHGIDAPEAGQSCLADGRRWAAPSFRPGIGDRECAYRQTIISLEIKPAPATSRATSAAAAHASITPQVVSTTPAPVSIRRGESDGSALNSRRGQLVAGDPAVDLWTVSS